MDLLSIRWRRPRRSQVVPELNQYPATPVVVNPYPGWTIHFEQTRNKTNRRLQKTFSNPVHPLTPPYISWVTHFEPTKNTTNRRALTLELNTYPATPVASVNDFYPGSQLITANHIRFRQQLQTVPEHNLYPLAPTPATLPAYLERKTFRHASRYTLLAVPEHNQYPVTPAIVTTLPAIYTLELPYRRITARRALTLPLHTRTSIALCSFSLNSIVSDRSTGLNSAITDTQGVNSTITDTQALNSSTSITTKGVESLIGNTTIGLTSEFCP